MKRHIDKYVGQPTLCQCRIDMGPILGQTFNWLCDDVMGKFFKDYAAVVYLMY